MLYDKQATTIDGQIAQLKMRGLQISDDAIARHYLSNISYYRLAGYWWPMQADKVNHVFKPNSRFEDVVALYNFDRELRLLLFDVIERIEIGLRSKMIYHLSHEYDAWWFFKRYKADLRFPPAWKTLEITSFGSLSKLYGNLKPTVKSKDIIAAELKTVNHTFLPSWLLSIAQIRNVCAHHGRLWNKNLPGRPNLLPKPPGSWLGNVHR